MCGVGNKQSMCLARDALIKMSERSPHSKPTPLWREKSIIPHGTAMFLTMMAHVIATRSRCGSGQGEQQTILDVDHFLCPCTMPLCEATSPKSMEPAVRHEVGTCLHEVTMHRSSYLLQENFPISKRPPNGLLNRIVETLLKSHSDSILLVQRCRCFHAKVSFRNTSRRENSLFFGRSHPVKK